MPRRILFISERYPPDLGGLATSAGRISRALVELGMDVDIISWTRSLQPGVVAEENSAPRVFRMGRYREWDGTMAHTQNLFDWLTHAKSYDAIWGHYISPAGFLATWFGELQQIPSTVSVRGNDLDREMFPPGDLARLTWTLQHASRITAVTEDLSRKVEALSGRRDVVCLKNVVDSSVFHPKPADLALRAGLGILPDEAILGFAGELREKKGQHFLLEALRRVRQDRPACLLVIGEIRPSEMPRLIQWTGPGTLPEHRIIVTGHLSSPDEVNQHLNLCDVYLQPSLWDGMPNALLEAMAAGCGCIVSDGGGIPEVVRNGVDGIVIPRWELRGLGDAALNWLSSPPAFRDSIRAAARDRMVSSFHYQQEREQLQAVMDRLIASSS